MRKLLMLAVALAALAVAAVPASADPLPYNDDDPGDWAAVTAPGVDYDGEGSFCDTQNDTCSWPLVSSDWTNRRWAGQTLLQTAGPWDVYSNHIVGPDVTSGTMEIDSFSFDPFTASLDPRDLPWAAEVCAYTGGQGLEFWARQDFALYNGSTVVSGSWFGELAGAVAGGTIEADGLSFDGSIISQSGGITITQDSSFTSPDGWKLILDSGDSGTCNWPELAS